MGSSTGDDMARNCSHDSYHVIDSKEVDGEEYVQYQCTDLNCEKIWWEKSE